MVSETPPSTRRVGDTSRGEVGNQGRRCLWSWVERLTGGRWSSRPGRLSLDHTGNAPGTTWGAELPFIRHCHDPGRGYVRVGIHLGVLTKTNRTLEDLWRTASPCEAYFDPATVMGLPEPARRYLLHTLAPGAPLSTCVRITMTGSIRLGAAWCPFEAEQVIRWERGFVWSAKARVKGLPVTGADSFVDDQGSMRWRILGIFPVMRADGPDISRAAAGRLHAEVMWVPAALLGPDVAWTSIEGQPQVSIHAHGEDSELTLHLTPDGGIQTLSLPRWGDQNTGTFGYRPFGGYVSEDKNFGGITLPTRYRIGWDFGTDKFESEGEFFRCTLLTVVYR